MQVRREFKGFREFAATSALKEIRDAKARRETLVHKIRRDLQARPDRQARRGISAHRGLEGFRVRKGR